ncbi:MAG: hypothetical protein AAF640_07085, partial [Pseudomonadota bacterium]
PNGDYAGPDSFGYASVDDDGAVDATPATVSITVTDVAEPNQPPVADDVTTGAVLADGTGPAGTLNNPQLVRFFSVDGDIDTGNEVNPSLGGSDLETGLSDLVFNLRSLPGNGTLYLDATGNGNFTVARVGDEFNSESNFYWAQKTSRITQDLRNDSTGVSVTGFDGSTGRLFQGGSGIGVQSTPDLQTEVQQQLAYRNGSSESITVDLGGPASGARIEIERLFRREGEVGRVEALDSAGNVIESWTFHGSPGATLDGVPVDFSIGGDDGSFAINDVSQPFFALRFTATPYADGNPRGSGNADSSDYFIRSIRYAPISFEGAEFTYDVTDADGNVSNLATVVIEPPSLAPIALDLDGNGVSYLARAADVVFTDQSDGAAVNTAWVVPEDGLLVIDANQSGSIDELREFVFTEWSERAATDLEAIAEVFDSDNNGVLDAGDAAWSQFGVWQDANSNGVTDEGELRSLGELGVESIALNYSEDSVAGIAADGDVVIHGQTEVTWDDGRVSTAEDASFALDVADVLVDGDELSLPAAGDDDRVIDDTGEPAPAPSSDGSNADAAALELGLSLSSPEDDRNDGGVEH